MLADRPFAWDPTNTSRAAPISPLDIPFKYNHGIAASNDGVLRTYGGTSAEWKTTGSPVFERTFGILTVTGPMPVCNCRAGKYPLRTTPALPSAVRRIEYFAT